VLSFFLLLGYLLAMGEAEAGLAVVSGTRLTDRIGVGVLTRLIDRDLVDDVLAETGRVERRSRLLPARVVVYYVLGLCLFFGEAYEEVMRLLVAGLLFTGTWQKDWQVPTTGAIAQARQRLGAEPLRLLFERVAVPCAQRGTRGAWLGPRRLMAIDGVRAGHSRYKGERIGLRPVRRPEESRTIPAGAPGRPGGMWNACNRSRAGGSVAGQ
jgi:Insertion element 4 transposase N-terminal